MTTFTSLSLLFVGVVIGVIFGAIPGLTSGIALAIILPFTFYLNAVEGMALLAGIYVAGTFGGSIAAILFGTPGAPEAGVTVLDGYPLAQKGYPGKALDAALYASTIANILSSITMIFLSIAIASLALLIGPTEFFAIILFSLVLIATLGMASAWHKGLIAVTLGLIFSFVGTDPISSISRLTFDNVSLSSGLSLIPVLVGLFVGAEIVGQTGNARGGKDSPGEVVFGGKDDHMTWQELKSVMPCILRGSFVGSAIGALPGLNAAVSAMINYSLAKRFSSTPEKFGTGILEGVAAPEAGNNGTVGPNLCPLLTLGIPGSGTAALFLGALLMQGITPGPTIFESHGEVVYGLFYALLFSSVFLVIVGKAVFRLAKYIPRIPVQIINPCIVLFCVSGSFAVSSQLSDIFVLLFFMLLGYLMRLGGLPVIPLLIGYLLGTLLETNLRRALLISGDDYTVFVTHPISLVFLIATCLLLAYTIFSRVRTKKPEADCLEELPG